MPAFAATAVDSAMTSGIASPSACGQAITSTVTVRSIASSTLPASIQATNVIAAGARWRRRTTAPRSGRRVPGHGSDSPARRRRGAGSRRARCRRRRRRRHAQRRIGRHRTGDDPIADRLRHRAGLARDHRLVELGRALDDAPVGRDPTAGAHEHDVADRQLVEADRRAPSPSTSSASSGSSSASAASAPRAWPIAFISCQCPSSMIVTSSASSHQNSRSSQPNSSPSTPHRRP